jgi:ribosomal protein S18 acetylase RimI-like enzyme
MTPKIRVRTAERRDAAALALIDASWKREAVSPGLKPRTRKEFESTIGKDIVIVAEEGGVPVGYAVGEAKRASKKHFEIDQDTLHINDLGDNETYVDLDSLYVLRRYRKRSVGKAIMKELMKETGRRGIRQILLAADNKKNPEGLVNFYRGLGFKIVVTYMKRDVGRKTRRKGLSS